MAGGNNKKQQKQPKVAKKGPQDKQKKGKDQKIPFPYGIAIMMVMLAIAYLLILDTRRNDGVFEKSSAGKFLKDTGALPYVEVAWEKSAKYADIGLKWSSVNLPIYINTTYTVLGPYGVFLKDASITALNAVQHGYVVSRAFVAEKTPVVINFIEQYAPGLPKKIADFFNSVCSFIHDVCETAADFLTTYVLIGRFSPDNLQKYYFYSVESVVKFFQYLYYLIDEYSTKPALRQYENLNEK